MIEQSVTLQPGESKVISFEAVPHEAKTYQVSVDGLSGSFRATDAPAAEFIYTAELAVTGPFLNPWNMPQYPTIQFMAWTVTIKNIGNAIGNCRVTSFKDIRRINPPPPTVWSGYFPSQNDIFYNPRSAEIAPGESVVFTGLQDPPLSGWETRYKVESEAGISYS